jgi:hypothetical protein
MRAAAVKPMQTDDDEEGTNDGQDCLHGIVMPINSSSAALLGSLILVSAVIYTVHYQQKQQKTRMHQAVVADKLRLKLREKNHNSSINSHNNSNPSS